MMMMMISASSAAKRSEEVGKEASERKKPRRRKRTAMGEIRAMRNRWLAGTRTGPLVVVCACGELNLQLASHPSMHRHAHTRRLTFSRDPRTDGGRADSEPL